MKKVNIFVITNAKYKICLCLIILSFIIAITVISISAKTNNLVTEKKELPHNITTNITNYNHTTNNTMKSENNTNSIVVTPKDTPSNKKEIPNLNEYENMPRTINGYKVLGQIIIPKINIEKYILEKTTKKALKKSVTKICGPEINQPGNLCIAGHNYNNIFGKVNLLEIGDKIQIKDTYDRILEYQIYKKEIVSPEDTSCLSQDTYDEKEITLVTCTTGAIKRIVIKAIEIYD